MMDDSWLTLTYVMTGLNFATYSSQRKKKKENIEFFQELLQPLMLRLVEAVNKQFEYQRSRSFCSLCPRSLRFQT